VSAKMEPRIVQYIIHFMTVPWSNKCC